MSSPEMNFSTPPDLAGLGRALAGLQPVDSHLDRDRVMFLAGKASVTPLATSSSRTWKAISGLATVAALVMATGCWSLWQENSHLRSVAQTFVPSVPHSPAVPDRSPSRAPTTITQTPPAAPSPAMPLSDEKLPSPATYLQLRNRIQQFGIESLAVNEPVSQGVQAPAATYESLSNEFHLRPAGMDASRLQTPHPHSEPFGAKS